MILEDGPLYTPEQVSDNGWLGQRSPEALRKAVSRGQLQHTKSGGKICFSRTNILANQEQMLVPAESDVPAQPATHRGRRAAPAVEVHPGVPLLVPKPPPERRRRRAS